MMEYQSVAPQGWERSDEKVFTAPKIEKTGEYDLSLLLRTDHKFPFMSLTVVINEDIFPHEEHLSDTISCPIFNENGGAKGGGISLFQQSLPVRTQLLGAGDSLVITVKHFMQRDSLPGVLDVGVSLVRK